MSLWAAIDAAIADAFASHADYLTAKGKEADRARRLIVRKVTKVVRDSVTAPREDDEHQTEAIVRRVEPSLPEPENWTCEIWSRDWWALFFAKVERRESTNFMLDFAMRNPKGTVAAISRASAPPLELIDRMKSFSTTGPELVAWRSWLRDRGVRLPEWKDSKFWIFLPSADPPDQSAA